MPYDPEKHLNCGRAMKSYIMRTMDTFMRAEAEAFHQIKLSPNKPVPIFAHFENFSVQLNHPKGVINPVSSTLQSTFLTCHAQAQIHKRSPQTCPAAPKVMEDVVGYVTKASSEFVQPGDTSCPQQEQMDAMKLEVQVRTVLPGHLRVPLRGALAEAETVAKDDARRVDFARARGNGGGAARDGAEPGRGSPPTRKNVLAKPPRVDKTRDGAHGGPPNPPNGDALFALDNEPRLSRLGPAPTGVGGGKGIGRGARKSPRSRKIWGTCSGSSRRGTTRPHPTASPWGPRASSSSIASPRTSGTRRSSPSPRRSSRGRVRRRPRRDLRGELDARARSRGTAVARAHPVRGPEPAGRKHLGAAHGRADAARDEARAARALRDDARRGGDCDCCRRC